MSLEVYVLVTVAISRGCPVLGRSGGVFHTSASILLAIGARYSDIS